MITAVDTSVLIDVLQPDPMFGPASADALRWAIGQGRVVACDVVWAEVSARFDAHDDVAQVLDRLNVGFSPLQAFDAVEAGRAWGAYRRRGGTRERVIADFLVGAHARSQAERLLTRDRGFFRTYFDDLSVVDPSAS